MSEDNSTFKLIGLKVLPECDERLRKVLKPDTIYFFCSDYEEDEVRGVSLRQDAQPLASSFFNVDRMDCPQISVSCIVGHNGDGKSSVIELLMRVINNFAYLAGFLSDHRALKFIPELYAEVYYQIDKIICCISCRGNKVQLLVGGEDKFSREYGAEGKLEEKKTKRGLAENKAQYLFYTLVSNFSLYAYNSQEFKAETKASEAEDSWVAALFHKNDAYQTPVVLSPQRIEGNINVNREYKLSLQRLSELFFDCRKGKYKISNTEKVEGIAYSLEDTSKLLTHTIEDFLLDENKGVRNVIVFEGDYNPNKRNRRNVLNLKKKEDLEVNISFWAAFDRRFYESDLLTIARDILVENELIEKTTTSSGGESKPETDLYKYMMTMRSKLSRRKGSVNAASRDNLEEFLTKGGGDFTFKQFQRLFLVFEIYKRWQMELGLGDLRSFRPSQIKVRDHAVWYLIYKSIRVFEAYPDFFAGGLRDYEIPHYFFSEELRNRLVNKWFGLLYKDIHGYKTHLTLKIRQTINYLTNDIISSCFMKEIDEKDEKDEVKTILAITGHKYYLDCSQYYDAVKASDDLASVLPPPFFVLDYVISRDDSALYPLSRMSSGERQLLNSASSVVYHLKNIAHSKPKGLKIVYRNVNVILEEVELYFHPEYQRRFIMYLLNQIQNANLPVELCINLLFVTHSPFILSDIPRQNVLFLKDGKPDRSMQEDTFGANIHTLLQNGFFLDSVPIGAFAKEKIANLFKLLNKSEKLSSYEMHQLEAEIPLVSEPLLRSQLMRLYSQRKGFEDSDYTRKIEELENRVKELEERLYDNT